MFANDLRSLTISTLASCGLLLGGCATETGETTHALSGDASVPVAVVPTPDGLERTAAPDWRLRTSTGVVDGCSETGEICQEGEQCCPLTGECVPADCDDCCVNPEIAGGPSETPELEGPERPDEPR